MRKLAILLIGLAAGSATIVLRCAQERPEWTTASAAAREAFEQGLSAEKQVYRNEAREHFARAVELDPEFAMARLKLLSLTRADPNRPKRMRALILDTDLDALSPREQFLMRHSLALIDRDAERAGALLEAYLQKHPNDLYALTIRCDGLWSAQKLGDAEQCFSKVLRVDPNWVLAQNHLGYIRMARGDFARAEEAFAAYERIAPDQANPHDSLGELLMLVGRYDEAQRAFESAVAIRSDFCASWSHLIDLAFLVGDREAADAALARAESAVCPPEFFRAQRCRAALWWKVADGTGVEAAAAIADLDCSGRDFDVLSLALAHGAAIDSGEAGLAAKLEQGAAESARAYRARSMPWPILRHMQARELASRGLTAEAIATLRRADEEATYSGESAGLFKLYNRLVLATLLETSARDAEAAGLRAAVDAVNPQFRPRFESLRAAKP
jgi:tetratricopeptide (TPR) repeat protein